jgi:hypothetical protein
MNCNHDNGNICVSCKVGTNSCCGEDIDCERCNESICRSCYEKYNKSCPVCSKEIVPDSQLVSWLLKKYNISRELAIQQYKQDN